MTTMNRTIKTRETVISVKTADHRKNLAHYMKQSYIRSLPKEKQEKEEEKSSSDRAITSLQKTTKKTIRESSLHLKRKRHSFPVFFQKESMSLPAYKENVISSSATKPYQKIMKQHGFRNYQKETVEQYSRLQHRTVFTFIRNIVDGTVALNRRAGRGMLSLASIGSGALLTVVLVLFFGIFSSFSNTSVIAEGMEILEASLRPDFTNEEAWGENNPYTRAGYIGQCTWFAWGRFYELYGYDPGFRGDGWNCAEQLVASYPDKFELSYIPSAGAVFSAIGRNHVGIVISVDEKQITIQEGNLDGRSNLFIEAITDWREVTYSLGDFIKVNGGVVYAAKK